MNQQRTSTIIILTAILLFTIIITLIPTSQCAVTFTGKWGSAGSDNGQLYWSMGVAIDAPTPIVTQNSTTITATQTETQETYNVTVNGNISAQQMSNMTITPHQTNGTTVVAFTVSGEAGTTGYANITIAKSAIPYGTIPKVYIDGVEAQNQGYTEDADNYYIWFTTHFSTHQVTIQYANAPVQTTASWPLIALVVAVVFVVLLITVAVIRKRKK